MPLLLSLFAIFTLAAATANARTITAASCSQSDVQAAVNSALAGDTVIVPPGVCHWSSTVTAPTAISMFQGAGIDTTVIVDDVSKSGTNQAALRIPTVNGLPFTLTGFTFQGGGGGTGFNASVIISGTSQAVRIHHNRWHNLNDIGLLLTGYVLGVIDHNAFDMGVKNTGGNYISTIFNAIRLDHQSWGGYAYGDGSWAEATNLGSGKALFVEDNTFNDGFANDIVNGGRMVFRHNSCVNASVQNHNGQGSRFRWARSIEVYNNTFVWSDYAVSGAAFAEAMYFRAGTGIIHDNIVTGYASMVIAFNDRSSRNEGFFGQATGSNPWDQNLDSSGYATIDQMGRGQGDLLIGDNPPAAWPNQALEPWYEWNNTYNKPANYGNAIKWGVEPTSTGVIKQNRDYFLDTQAPAYTPYTYPHPLTTTDSAPLPPTQLAVH